MIWTLFSGLLILNLNRVILINLIILIILSPFLIKKTLKSGKLNVVVLTPPLPPSKPVKKKICIYLEYFVLLQTPLCPCLDNFRVYMWMGVGWGGRGGRWHPHHMAFPPSCLPLSKIWMVNREFSDLTGFSILMTSLIKQGPLLDSFEIYSQLYFSSSKLAENECP